MVHSLLKLIGIDSKWCQSANNSSDIGLWYYHNGTQVTLFTENLDQITHHVQWTRICYTVDSDNEDETVWYLLF